jgi:hypothetical protein
MLSKSFLGHLKMHLKDTIFRPTILYGKNFGAQVSFMLGGPRLREYIFSSLDESSNENEQLHTPLCRESLGPNPSNKRPYLDWSPFTTRSVPLGNWPLREIDNHFWVFSLSRL